VFLIIPVFIYSQNNVPEGDFAPDNFANKTDSLKELYGYGKLFITDYEFPALVALTYYPALDSTIIEIKNKKINTLGRVRPKAGFLFRKQENRPYIIIINKTPEDKLGFGFSEMPLSAQIGLFGHEFAHITDYSDKKNIQMILFGIKYLLMKRKIERYTDITAIEHGMGQQLYDLNMFIRNHPSTDKKYLRFKENNYLSPEEISEKMLNFTKN
jgi:hypothetical protein